MPNQLGPQPASAASQTASGGSNPWSNLSNILTTTAYATAVLYGSDASVHTSYMLEAMGFGFAVPSTATVVGVQASVKHTQTGGTSAVYDNNVTLLGVSGTPYNRAQPGHWSGAETYYYGTPTDLWGVALTPAVVNGPTFGLGVQCVCTLLPGSGADVGIGYITLTVFYAPAGGSGGSAIPQGSLRTQTSGLFAELGKETVRPVIFVEAEFADGTVYMWSGIGPIAWDGQTWLGLGWLGKVTAMAETTTGQARGVTLELSGIPSNLIGEAVAQASAQYPVIIWLGFLDASGAVIADPEKRFSGRMDVVRIAEGGDTSSIQINVESKLIDLQRARERHYTDQDQKIDYPSDDGFMYVNGIQELSVVWGHSGSAINNLPVVGGQSGSGNSPPQRGPGRGPYGPGYPY